MAQKWAEGKRNILLVVPASLRKQWSQELQDKFELPSIIIDSKVAAALKKEGIHNPFSHECKIAICSYEYVARQKEKVQLVDWHLVVFDEAHKLRNIYQNSGSKRAKTIVEATQYADSRVLLSATPIQNKLMELYGLSQVIDAHYFGDAKSFRKLYVNRQNDKQALEDLKQRIEPLCHRTLRRQDWSAYPFTPICRPPGTLLPGRAFQQPYHRWFNGEHRHPQRGIGKLVESLLSGPGRGRPPGVD